MVGIDLGHHQRHVGVHAVAAGVRDHDVAGRGELGLGLIRDFRTQGGEQQAARQAVVDGRRHFHLSDLGRQGPGLHPGDSFSVRAPGGAPRAGQGRDLEPGVARQQGDEALADAAGRSEHGDRNLFVSGHLCSRDLTAWS